jgi:hypothetical protein
MYRVMCLRAYIFCGFVAHVFECVPSKTHTHIDGTCLLVLVYVFVYAFVYVPSLSIYIYIKKYMFVFFFQRTLNRPSLRSPLAGSLRAPCGLHFAKTDGGCKLLAGSLRAPSANRAGTAASPKHAKIRPFPICAPSQARTAEC